LEQSQPVTCPTNHIARLPDQGSPIGACPALTPGWADLTYDTVSNPAITAEGLAVDPIVVHATRGRPCHLVISGDRRLIDARAAGLLRVPVCHVDAELDVAIFYAIRSLITDAAHYASARRTRRLLTYLYWLRTQTYVDQDHSYRTGPLVESVLGDSYRQLGLEQAIALVSGFSSRSLRARYRPTTDASPAHTYPPPNLIDLNSASPAANETEFAAPDYYRRKRTRSAPPGQLELGFD
jgi:hypothetical protein